MTFKNRFALQLCSMMMLCVMLAGALLPLSPLGAQTAVVYSGTHDFSSYTSAGTPDGISRIASNLRSAGDGSYDKVYPVDGAFGKETGDIAVGIEKNFLGTLTADSSGKLYKGDTGYGHSKSLASDDYIELNNIITELYTASDGYANDALHFSFQFAYDGAADVNRYANARFYYPDSSGENTSFGMKVLDLSSEGTLSIAKQTVDYTLQSQKWYDIDAFFFLNNADGEVLSDGNGKMQIGIKLYINGNQMYIGEADENGIYYYTTSVTTPFTQLYFLRMGSESGSKSSYTKELTLFDNITVSGLGYAELPSFEPLPDSLSVPSIFASGAVLPRDTSFNIWGKAYPSSDVTVKLDGKTYSTKADAAGDWSVAADALSVSGAPYTLVISDSDGTELSYDNILAGDVWLCGGQSNMYHSYNTLTKEEGYDYTEEIAQIQANDNIRFFYQDIAASSEAQWDVTGGYWAACNAETACKFSAEGYYFGKYLEEAIDVPVGLIFAARGGTMIESWMSQEAMKQNPLIAHRAEYVDSSEAAKSASRHYNSMIAPLMNFKIKGVIWHQGEANQTRHYEYLELHKALISSWRDSWGYDFPFIITQLESLSTRYGYIFIREEQRKVTEQVANTDMAVIMDLGDPEKEHPREREEVGRRLSLAAQKTAYGLDVESGYPYPASVSYNGDNAVITYENYYDGLKTSDGTTAVTGFKVSNADGEYYDAKAVISSPGTVTVSCDGVNDIRGIQYGFEPYPDPELNLYNSANLIASPFRDGVNSDKTVNLENYTTSGKVPPSGLEYIRSYTFAPKNDLIYAPSDGSYRAVNPVKGLYGKDANNTSVCMESVIKDGATGDVVNADKYLEFKPGNVEIEAQNPVHVRFQLAYEGNEDALRAVTATIYGTTVSKNYSNFQLVAMQNGSLLVHKKSTDVTLKPGKWYTFDLVLTSDMRIKAYVNGRKVTVSGEDSDGYVKATGSKTSDWTSVSQLRFGYVDKANGQKTVLAVDNIFVEPAASGDLPLDPVIVVYDEANDVLSAEVSILDQTDLSSSAVVVGVYGENNELLSVVYKENVTLENGAARISVKNADIAGAKSVKVFAWSDDSALTPLDSVNAFEN